MSRPEPYPLDEVELRTAQACVAHEIRLIVDNLGDFEPGELDGEQVLNLFGTWNALEQHLSFREGRPQRRITGEELSIEYDNAMSGDEGV